MIMENVDYVRLFANWITEINNSIKSKDIINDTTEYAIKDINNWYMKKNERYLHHWFSSHQEMGSTFKTDDFHPEWPSHKVGHNDPINRNQYDDQPVLYQKAPREGKDSTLGGMESQPNDKDEEKEIKKKTKTKKAIINRFNRTSDIENSRASFTDFAIGNYLNPQLLIEFKWNNLFHEWAFDFYKLCDRRLPANERIFFGVRSTHSKGSADATINEYLNLVVEKINAEEQDKHEWTKKPFKTMLIDVQFVSNESITIVRSCLVTGKENEPITPPKWEILKMDGPCLPNKLDEFLSEIWKNNKTQTQ